MTLQIISSSGASIAYKVQGEGPSLFLVGAPVGISGFAALAERLAAAFTVVTHDPRGIGESTNAEEKIPSPTILATDLALLIESLSAQPATIFGASGGAVTGIELLTRRPELVRRLVAHEPPLFTLLPDADSVLEKADKAFALAPTDPDAAAQGFADVSEALHSTYALSPRPQPVALPPGSPAEQEKNRYFLGRMAPATVHYRPHPGSLGGGKLILAAGEASIGQPARRATEALARQTGAPFLDAPGNHFGIALQAEEFAQWLTALLAGEAAAPAS